MRQHELAEAVGVSKSTVANWESGRHFPLRFLGKVEEVLGIDLSAEEQRPVIPASIRDAIRRELAPADQERVLRAIEDALTGQGQVNDGDPDVALCGGLGVLLHAPAEPDHDGAPPPVPI